MAFQDMLNHKCAVYHIIKTGSSPGYGLPSSPSFSYPDEPDIAELACHFNTKSGAPIIIQEKPHKKYEGKVKLVYPIDSDIRLNDKIVNLQTGYEYTAGIPVRVRDHHMFVMLQRDSTQEPL